jgi:amino acid/amide ABC transporter membrane protein 1, HAAT family (TC 3.A.1.4.-)
MLFVLPPAIASAADSGAQAVDECNPTASNGCVNGILQDADKKPIADVTITLSGKATAETKTAADGKWAFSVADDGDYTVTIDASVAKEHGLKASSATVTIRKASFDKQRGVVRFDQAGDSPAAARPAHLDRPARQTARKARPAHPDRRRPRNRQSKKTAPMSANASGSNCIPALSSA